MTTIRSILLTWMCCGAMLAGQSTLQVPSSAYPTIQSAINGAQSGDTIQVGPGVYLENLDFLNKQLDLIGAGIDVSIIDANFNGGCIYLGGGNGVCLIEGFTLQNGTGHVFPTLGAPITMGGGIFAGANIFPAPIPTIRRCRFYRCTADIGGGIGNFYSALFTVEDCIFDDVSRGAIVLEVGGPHAIRRCVFKNSGTTGDGGGGIGASAWGGLPGTLVEDCLFVNNTVHLPNPNTTGVPVTRGSVVGLSDGAITFRRCVFDGNSSDEGSVIAKLGGYGTVSYHTQVFEDCLFVNNVANLGAVVRNQGTGIDFRNCTFANNTTLSPTGATLLWTFGLYPMQFTNCIFWGNSGAGPLVVNGMNDNSVTFTHCDLQGGWTGPGNGNISVDPLYEDPGAGDYHIRPDSPCVNAGTASQPFFGSDSDGDARPLYGGVDMGYDECADFSLDPAAAGTAGLALTGSATDVLAVNGTAGGALRRVDLGLGQSFTVTLTPPPGNLSSDFVLYGILGTAKAATVTALPFGLPDMVFSPCDLAPSLQPILFTLAASVSGLSCAPIASTSPAPWSSPAWSLPFPVTFTLQGLIVDTPLGTSLASTNAIRVRVQ